MPILGNDRNRILTKDFFCPYHRIKRAESRIIKVYDRIRHSYGYQGLTHVFWLVIPVSVIVTADQNIGNLICKIQLRSGLNPI